LESITERLSASSRTITALETQLKMWIKVCIALSALLILRLLALVIGIFLYAKGIPVPRWMDILI
jgi:hypothetical protein